MEILPEIAKRVSVRDFQDREVPGDVLERILEAGRLAPSAKNRQPWRFVAVTDPEKRKLLEKASFGQEHVGSAPVVVACCTTNIEYRMPNGQLSYPIDISLAASFMMLQAVREGLGTCIVTTYDETQAREIITVPCGWFCFWRWDTGRRKRPDSGRGFPCPGCPPSITGS